MHLIERQLFDISAPSRSIAQETQDYISMQFNEEILPEIDLVFSELVTDNTWIQIEKLEIDLGVLSRVDLRSELKEIISNKLNEKLSELLLRPHVSVNTSIEIVKKELKNTESKYSNNSLRKADALFSFLKNGHFPWWLNKNGNQEVNQLLEKVISESPQLFLSFLDSNKRKSYIFSRLAKQFSGDSFALILTTIDETIAKKIFLLFDELTQFFQVDYPLKVEGDENYPRKKYSVIFEQNKVIKSIGHTICENMLNGSFSIKHFFKELLLFLANNNQINLDDLIYYTRDQLTFEKQTDKHFTLIEGLFSQISASAASKIIKPKIDIELSDEITIPDTTGESIFIQNAGLVIVAPFLGMFFKKLGLIASGKFISEKAKERAVLLTQYLVTGQEEIEEPFLSINKIICGWDLWKPVNNHIDISNEEKKEVEDLLQSVIVRWGALGSTSIGGLQHSFFKRDGKLMMKEGHYQLIIERKGIDVLLDKLQWGIGLIKMPWMKKTIYVEW